MEKRKALPCWPRNAYSLDLAGGGVGYSRDKVIGTSEMSLTFSASVDFISVEISKVLETLLLTSIHHRQQ